MVVKALAVSLRGMRLQLLLLGRLQEAQAEAGERLTLAFTGPKGLQFCELS